MPEEDKNFNVYWILFWIIPSVLLISAFIAKIIVPFYFMWLFQLSGALYMLFSKKFYFRHWFSRFERIFWGTIHLIMAIFLLLCTIDVFHKFGWS